MSPSSRPAAPAGTWRLGHIGGVDLLVKPSIVLMAVLLIALFAPRFDDRSSSNPYVLAAVFVVALYVSVFIHELAHVWVARRFGMRVQSVTLHLLGGETLIEGESRTPWQELSTAIAGPITSLAIGFGALSMSRSLSDGTTSDILWSIGYVNILVGMFNMLPGLPLDGGRVFRAIIWQVTGREQTGVRIAAWIGRAAALGLVAFALLHRDSGNRGISNLLVALLVAWFLWQGASDALQHAGRASRISLLVARTLADTQQAAPPGAPRLSADLHGAELLRAMASQPADVYALTEADGSHYGVLNARAVDDAYRASR